VSPLSLPSPLALFAAGALLALAAGAALASVRLPEGTAGLGWRIRWGLWRLGSRLDRRAAERWHDRGLAQADPARGAACLEEAARLGHGEAHFELGLWYEAGGQGPGARDRAVRHYRAAAEMGHLEAGFRLGELLRWGIGPDRDPGAGLRWLQRSAHGGFRPAMEALARAFETGDGVGEDLEASVTWTLKAREAEPRNLRGSRLARRGPTRPGQGGPVPPPRPEAPGPGPEAEAHFRMGMGLLEGARDPAAARAWLRRAAEAGHLEAMAELGGLLARENDPEAAPWLRRAGALGHRGAQVRLGALEPPSRRGR